MPERKEKSYRNKVPESIVRICIAQRFDANAVTRANGAVAANPLSETQRIFTLRLVPAEEGGSIC